MKTTRRVRLERSGGERYRMRRPKWRRIDWNLRRKKLRVNRLREVGEYKGKWKEICSHGPQQVPKLERESKRVSFNTDAVGVR